MEEIDNWLRQTKAHSGVISQAYGVALDRLWWANLMFVVVPAVLSTTAAIVAALPKKTPADLAFGPLPLASICAGSAAILIAVHKALKCDEHQAECRRLGQLHESIALLADAALSRPEGERASRQELILQKLREVTEGARARLPGWAIRAAEKRCGPSHTDGQPAGAAGTS